jgi:NAD(P)-dependent dehydrogenase (short-subunit alcohol dehydrogenase family)
MNVSSPVALITGAGRGIGRAAALELAKANYELALVARSSSDLADTARLVGRGMVVPMDVTDPDAVESCVTNTVYEYGRLDAIIHCAGLAPVKSIPEMTVALWREVLETNLSAAFYLCRAAWPQFKKQNSGVVVNISSEASRDPFPGFAAYGAAKAALNLFGRSAAREGQPLGVRVHTIAPSAVETEMFRQILTKDQYPTEKTLSPEDVARVIVQCVRGDLAHTSGEVIYIHKTL